MYKVATHAKMANENLVKMKFKMANVAKEKEEMANKGKEL